MLGVVPSPDGIQPLDICTGPTDSRCALASLTHTAPPYDAPGDFTRYGFRVPLGRARRDSATSIETEKMGCQILQPCRSPPSTQAQEASRSYSGALKLQAPSVLWAGGLGGVTHGGLAKSKNSVMSGWLASRCVNGARLKRVSMNFKTAV